MMKSKRSIWRLTPLLAFLIMMSFLWRGLHLNPHELPSALINKPMPEFAVTDFNNRHANISNKALYGQISLVNVFASWCESCEQEQPILMDIARDKSLYLLGIDYKDTKVEAEDFLNRVGNPFSAIAFDYDGKMAINLGVYGTPETFIVDPNGVIRYKHIGVLTQAVWQKKLLPVINQLKREFKA